MSTDAVSQDLMSILRMFSSPRMGPFENTNAPAPKPPEASVANATPPGPGTTSLNERQSELPAPGPPQPVSRRVLPDGGGAGVPLTPADISAPGANEAKLTMPAPGSGEGGPGLATQPPVAPGTGEMPDFVSSNPVWQAYEKQRQRLYQEAQERQKLELSASGFGGLMQAFGGRVTGGVGGEGGGAITSPGSSAATGSGVLGIDDFAKFKKAADDAVADQQDMARIDRMLQDPKMKGRVSRDALLTLRANDKNAFTKLVADYFSAETETKVLEDGTLVSRPKNAPADTPYTPVQEDAMKKALKSVELAKAGQGLIDPRLQSDEVLKQIARATNQPRPDDPATLAMLRSMSAEKLQEMIERTSTAAAGVAQPREWESIEIKEKQAARTKINTSVGSLPTLEYLTSKIDEGMRTGSWVGDQINNFNRNIGNFIGVERGTMNADEYNAAVQSEVQKVIKQYGANASDRDARAAEASFGAGLGPQAARAQLSFVAKSKVWEVHKHNADIQSRLDRGIMTDQNGRALDAQKADYPKPTEQVLNTMNIAPVAVEALKAHPNDPEMRAAFRDKYGDYMAEWVLGEIK